jgi:hypothetical protein
VALKLNWSLKARANFRALPNPQVGQAIAALLRQIATDPIAMTRGETQGVRVFDGMVIGAGSSYYTQIHFVHTIGTDNITIWQIQAFLASGPH